MNCCGQHHGFMKQQGTSTTWTTWLKMQVHLVGQQWPWTNLVGMINMQGFKCLHPRSDCVISKSTNFLMIVTLQQLIMIWNLNMSIELYLVISSIFHQLTMHASIPMARLGCQSTHLVWTEIDWTIDIVSGLWSVLHAMQGWAKQISNATISRKSWIFHVCVPSKE